MGRLIDADALIEVLKHLSYFHADDMQNLVASQPTAYDVEKVVAELGKLTIDCEVGQIYNGMYIRRKDAIDIVRAGGKE